jgi:hypothetical protein
MRSFGIEDVSLPNARLEIHFLTPKMFRRNNAVLSDKLLNSKACARNRESKHIFITRLSEIALYLRVAIVPPIRAILSLMRFVVVDTQHIHGMQQKQYWRMRICSLLYIGPHACLASMSGNCSTYSRVSSRDFIVDAVRSSRYTV